MQVFDFRLKTFLISDQIRLDLDLVFCLVSGFIHPSKMDVICQLLTFELQIIIKDLGVRSMISFQGSLSFAKLVLTSSAAIKSTGNARNASQDPVIVPYNLSFSFFFNF